MRNLKYLLLSLLLIIPNIVNASEIYFKNENNVSLTKKEYDYIVKRFSSEFATIMTDQDYKNLIKEELINSKINIVTNTSLVSPLASSSHTTKSKSLTMTSACASNYCNITLAVEWLKEPTVKSYDVIGVYLMNNSLVTSPITYTYSTNGAVYSNEIVKQNNGFGVSVKVPSGDNIKVYQYFDITPTGAIYGSYQHATSSISLVNSKKYTISRSGYGGVFSFDSSVKEKYDAMSGVNITI